MQQRTFAAGRYLMTPFISPASERFPINKLLPETQLHFMVENLQVPYLRRCVMMIGGLDPSTVRVLRSAPRLRRY